MATLDKTQESKNGYWTDDEPRGITVAVGNTRVDGACRISLMSEYWWRVQHFTVSDCNTGKVWGIVKQVMKDCGRSLVPYAVGEKDQESETDDRPVYYSVPYLSNKQVDQLYYLLKHSLTTNRLDFALSHGVRFPSYDGIVAPKKRRKRRKKPGRVQPGYGWQQA